MRLRWRQKNAPVQSMGWVFLAALFLYDMNHFHPLSAKVVSEIALSVLSGVLWLWGLVERMAELRLPKAYAALFAAPLLAAWAACAAGWIALARLCIAASAVSLLLQMFLATEETA